MEYIYSVHNSFLSGEIIYRSDGVWIPSEEANTDYQKYLAWIEEGNTPQEWQPESEEQ